VQGHVELRELAREERVGERSAPASRTFTVPPKKLGKTEFLGSLMSSPDAVA
jgi:hypothetical protein